MLALFALLLFIPVPRTSNAQVGVAIQPFTYPDITGAGSTTQLSSTLGCNSFQLIAPAANSASIR